MFTGHKTVVYAVVYFPFPILPGHNFSGEHFVLSNGEMEVVGALISNKA